MPQLGVEGLLDEFGQNPLVVVETFKVADDGAGMPIDDRLDRGNGVGDDLRCHTQVDPAVVVRVDAAEFIPDLIVDDVIVISGAAASEHIAEPEPLVYVIQDPPGDLVVLAPPEGGKRRS